MKKNMNELGRSMLEVIGVIVVIAVLSIAGLTGYDYIVQYRKRQETAKIASSAVMTVRSGDLARQVNQNTLIKAKTIIPVDADRMDDDFFKLPDSEESYAVVHSMDNGGFTMALKVDPGTCSTIFDQLSLASVSAFAPSDAGFTEGGNWKAESKRATEELNTKSDKEEKEVKYLDGTIHKVVIQGSEGVDLSLKKDLDAALSQALKKSPNGKISEDAKFNTGNITLSGKTVKKWNQITTECAERGQLMISSGCSGGSSPDHHSSGFICGGCELGKVPGQPGENPPCCYPEELCDGWCQCPAGTKKVTTSGVCHCQICNPNDEGKDVDACMGAYKKYSKHVCYDVKGGADCVECREDADCQTRPSEQQNYKVGKDSYTDKSFYDKFQKMFCINESICRECNKSYDSQYSEEENAKRYEKNVYCPKKRPICSPEGVCGKCPADFEYDEVQGCICPEGFVEYVTDAGVKTCVTCVDNHAKDDVDIGCGSAKPYCYPEESRSKKLDEEFADGASNKYWTADHKIDRSDLDNRRCVECVVDSDCPGGYCDSYISETDFNAKTGVKYKRDYKKPHSYTCQIEESDCKDDQIRGDQDTGCDKIADQKLCMPDANKMVNAGDSKPGSKCMECFDNGTQQDGCTGDKKLCKKEADTGNYGTCAMCQWTEDANVVSSSNPDRGCDAKKTQPVCRASAKGEYGDACYVCQNDQHDGNNEKKDRGCTDAKPLCPAKVDEYTDLACKLCQNNQPSHLDGEYDLGCKTSDKKPICGADGMNAFGDTCYVCQDTATGADKDDGCGYGENEGLNLCGVASTTGGTKQYGDRCYKCVDDKNDQDHKNGDHDTGCNEEGKPVCSVSEAGQYGTTCIPHEEPPKCKEGYFSKSGQKMDQAACDKVGGCSLENSWCWQEESAEGEATDRCFCEPCHNGYLQEAGNNDYINLKKEEGSPEKCTQTVVVEDKKMCVCPKCPAVEEIEAAIQNAVLKNSSCGVGEKHDLIESIEIPDGCCYHVQTSPLAGDDKFVYQNGSKTVEWGSVCKTCARPAKANMWRNEGLDFYIHGTGESVSLYAQNMCGESCGWLSETKYSEWYENTEEYKSCPNNECRETGKSLIKVTAADGQCADPSGKTQQRKCGCKENECYDEATQDCIDPSKYDDLEVADDGTCHCLASVRTQTIKDYGNSISYGKNGVPKDSERGYKCERLTSNRQREYSIPVHFYCPRYMHVSDTMQADDFVAGSYPTGIGDTSPAKKSKSWQYAHVNKITPKVSSATIGGKDVGDDGQDIAFMRIQDRWLGEVGMGDGNERPAGGYFYFTLDPSYKEGGRQTLKVTASWGKKRPEYWWANWDSEQTSKANVTGYKCKDGAGSSLLKKAKGDAHCSKYCD